jgi:hypothetical protein
MGTDGAVNVAAYDSGTLVTNGKQKYLPSACRL